jgi:glucans biosynthesis protein
MHGGARGSGAPKGNQNALRHGTYTAAALCERAELRLLIQESTELLRSLDEDG